MTVRSRSKTSSHQRVPLEPTSDMIVAYATCNDLPDYVRANLQSPALRQHAAASSD